MDVKTALTEYGLNEKEITIYLSLLQNGSQTANSLSKNTGILRQSIYDLLNNLEHKGLISEVIEDDKKHFIAENPKALLKTLKEKEKVISDVLPSLESLQKSLVSDVSSKTYKGIKGIKLLYEDFLESKTEIKTIQPDIPEAILKEYFIENYLIKRIEKKIPTKILKGRILTEFQESINTNKKKFREVRLNPAVKEFKAHIILYDNKIVMIDYRDEIVAVVIENDFFTKSFNILFDFLWKESKIF